MIFSKQTHYHNLITQNYYTVLMRGMINVISRILAILKISLCIWIMHLDHFSSRYSPNPQLFCSNWYEMSPSDDVE